jgi:hypothetical protein
VAGSAWIASFAARQLIRLVVRDPARSGDGMLGAGAFGVAVWPAGDRDGSP